MTNDGINYAISESIEPYPDNGGPEVFTKWSGRDHLSIGGAWWVERGAIHDRLRRIHPVDWFEDENCMKLFEAMAADKVDGCPALFFDDFPLGSGYFCYTERTEWNSLTVKPFESHQQAVVAAYCIWKGIPL